MGNGLPIFGCVGVLLALQFVTLCRVTHVARGLLLTAGGFLLYVAVNGAFLWGCMVAGFSPLAQIQLGCFVLWIPLVAFFVALSHDDRWRTLFIALDYVAYLTAILPICHAVAFRKLTVFGGGGADLLTYLPRRGTCDFSSRAVAAYSAFE